MIILDSNIWIAQASKKDSQHEKALKLIAGLNDLILIPEYVMIETCTVLSQRAGKSSADAFIDATIGSAWVQFLYTNQTLFAETLQTFRTLQTKHLSFIDVALFCLSRTHNVLTFDKHLARAIAADKKKSK